MQQVLVHLPWIGWPVFGFGLMLFVAFVLTTWLAGRRAQREGINSDSIQDLALWVFLGGLIGARIWHMYLMQKPPATFWDFLTQLVKIWEGGIILYGSVLGGLVGYFFAWWFLFRKQKVSTFKVLDVIAPSIALGLCIGRIGCFLNGCCYGQVACADCPIPYAAHFPLSALARYDLVRGGYQTAAGFTLDENRKVVGRVTAGGPNFGAEAQALTGLSVVGRVVKGSPAAAAGLRDGDEIVKTVLPDGEQQSATPAHLDDYLGPNWPKGGKELRLVIRHPGEAEQMIAFTPRTLGLHPTQLYESVSMLLLFLLLLAYAPLKTRDGQVMALLMMCYAVHRFVNEKLRSDPRPIGFESYSSVILFAAGALLMLYLLLRPAQYKPQWRADDAASATGPKAPAPRSGGVAIKRA
jgi:prolipoprotein diacylglyceryltransferase